MQGFTAAVRPRFVQLVNRPSPKIFSLRAFSSSSSDYGNQSRGGLPRFFSEVFPSSKAILFFISLIYTNARLAIIMNFYFFIHLITQGSIVRVEGDEFWHMTKVLRLSTNDR